MVLKSDWAKYRPKLLPLLQQTEQRNNHKFAAEIDEALSADRAFLFVGDDGFFVLEPLIIGAVMMVNVMFAFNWGDNAIDRYQSEIERLARDVGARQLLLQTKVKGIEPIIERHGWRLDHIDDDCASHWFKVL